MSTYGASRETTPRITGIAARGTRFTRAYSTSPWTLPAHAAMLTGRYPTSLTPDPTDLRLVQTAPMLSHLFQEAGYRTAAFTDGGWVSKALGFDRGFEFYQETTKRQDTSAALSWIEENRETPFFLFFHTYMAHVPFTDRRFVGDLDRGSLNETTRPDGAITVWLPPDQSGLTEEQREYVLALYDGGLARADEMVGQIWDRLEALDLVQRTSVVITSDHGAEYWEHTGRGAMHGHTLYDELLEVPLVWYEPGREQRGRTVDEPVGLIDIVPTAARRFALDVPAGIDGVDLSPLLDGDSWSVDRSLFAEGTRKPAPPLESVRSAQGKLIAHVGPIRELYLPDDPAESVNRIEDDGALAAELESLLDEHRRAAVPSPPEMEKPSLDAQTRERLEALGYLGDDSGP